MVIWFQNDEREFINSAPSRARYIYKFFADYTFGISSNMSKSETNHQRHPQRRPYLAKVKDSTEEDSKMLLGQQSTEIDCTKQETFIGKSQAMRALPSFRVLIRVDPLQAARQRPSAGQDSPTARKDDQIHQSTAGSKADATSAHPSDETRRHLPCFRALIRAEPPVPEFRELQDSQHPQYSPQVVAIKRRKWGLVTSFWADLEAKRNKAR